MTDRRSIGNRVLSKEDIHFLLNSAILAPSMHNTQPWIFSVRETSIEVRRDRARELSAEDPERRASFLSIGAVVFNLRVAAGYLGALARVSTLSQPDDPDLAVEATITPAVGMEDAGRAALLGKLYPQVARRRTNRMPFEDREIASSIRKELVSAATAEGAALQWVPRGYRTHWLMGLAASADMVSAGDSARRAEQATWVGGDRDREGIPSSSLGPRSREWRAPVRNLGVDPDDVRRASEQFEPHPLLAVLSTKYDQADDWIAAGQALQHVLLVATARGLSTSLLNQPIEFPAMRWLVRDPFDGWPAPQVVLRFGYGPPVPSTPRRSLEEFLERDSLRQEIAPDKGEPAIARDEGEPNVAPEEGEAPEGNDES